MDEYCVGSRPFSDLGKVATEADANFKFNMTTGRITEKDALGFWPIDEKLYESNEIELYIKSDYTDLPLMMSSDDFVKYLNLNDFVDLSKAVFSKYLSSAEFILKATKAKQLREHINLYEYKLQKMVQSSGDEVEIFRLEKMLDELYEKQREF